MIRRGSGRGKLIFFGEHAAVYGFPAVGIPLPLETTLELHPGTEIQGEPTLPDEKGTDYRTFRSLLADLDGQLESSYSTGGTWRRRSDVPRSGGFGSSAALCTAMARIALNRGTMGYDREVHLLANRLEGRFHGTPSGIDTGMACDTSPAAWIAEEGDLPIRDPLEIPPWFLCYGALPREENTAGSVGGLRNRWNHGEASIMDAMEKLGSLAMAFMKLTKGIREGTVGAGAPGAFPQAAGALANQAQELLAAWVYRYRNWRSSWFWLSGMAPSAENSAAAEWAGLSGSVRRTGKTVTV